MRKPSQGPKKVKKPPDKKELNITSEPCGLKEKFHNFGEPFGTSGHWDYETSQREQETLVADWHSLPQCSCSPSLL